MGSFRFALNFFAILSTVRKPNPLISQAPYSPTTTAAAMCSSPLASGGKPSTTPSAPLLNRSRQPYAMQWRKPPASTRASSSRTWLTGLQPLDQRSQAETLCAAQSKTWSKRARSSRKHRLKKAGARAFATIPNNPNCGSFTDHSGFYCFDQSFHVLQK